MEGKDCHCLPYTGKRKLLLLLILCYYYCYHYNAQEHKAWPKALPTLCVKAHAGAAAGENMRHQCSALTSVSCTATIICQVTSLFNTLL